MNMCAYVVIATISSGTEPYVSIVSSRLKLHGAERVGEVGMQSFGRNFKPMESLNHNDNAPLLCSDFRSSAAIDFLTCFCIDECI